SPSPSRPAPLFVRSLIPGGDVFIFWCIRVCARSARAQGLDRGGAPGLGRRERCPGFLGFAESTLSNQQLADGDDTDEELRREVIVVKAVTGRRGGFGTRPMI
uniref:Uncharacterized protein n=1 Tax=Aegilops tauschii subsp. strangulata TaxID=200361 RepID=A0A453R949_AEGTS